MVFKLFVKAKITDYWEFKLRSEAAPVLNKSLCYFHPEYFSLKTPHKLLVAAGNKPYKVAKSVIQLKFLWPTGLRKTQRGYVPSLCATMAVPLNPQNTLCPAYSSKRHALFESCLKVKYYVLCDLVRRFLVSGTAVEMVQFLKWALWVKAMALRS